jgi:hypothetical protein
VRRTETIAGREYATYAFDLADLDLQASYVERVMHHDPQDPSGPWTELIEETLHEAAGRCTIEGGYTIADGPVFDESGRTLRLGHDLFHLEKIVFGQIRKAERIALFLCTAGPIGEWSRELARAGDPLRAYVVDVVGSEIVEFAVDRIHHDLGRRCADEELRITNRFSPGYCNWDVREQGGLFRSFPPGYAGIRLSESCLMHPTKSVSGIVGIGHRVKLNPYLCNVCSEEMCIYRDKRLLDDR